MKYPVTINGEVQTRGSRYEATWGVVVWRPYDPKPRLTSVRSTRSQAHQSASYHLKFVNGWEEKLTQVHLVPIGGSIDLEPTSRIMVQEVGLWNWSFRLREDGREIATAATSNAAADGTLTIPHLNVAVPCNTHEHWGDFRDIFRNHIND